MATQTQLTKLEANENLDYDVVRGDYIPGCRGSRHEPAEAACYEVTLQIRGYFPADLIYDFPDNSSLGERDRAFYLAKELFLEKAPITELNQPEFDWYGPDRFCYHKVGGVVTFTCQYEGYERI